LISFLREYGNMLMVISLVEKLGSKHSLSAFSVNPGLVAKGLGNHLKLFGESDGRCNTDRSKCIVCAAERRELSLPAAAGGLKTMGYGRMATHRPGGVLSGGHSPSKYDEDIISMSRSHWSS
jgi:hypothetical protein